MRILLIGAGYVGRAVAEELVTQRIDVLHTYNEHPSLSDSIRLNLFENDLNSRVPLTDVDVVIVTANIEKNSETETVRAALENLFTSCAAKRVVYTSSDAVFDGTRGRYTEADAPNPITSYGKHKLIGEQLLRERVPNSCVIRPSYVYGYSVGRLDRRLHEAVKSAQAGQLIPRLTDMFKSPTEVNFLAKTFVAIAASDVRGTFHVGGDRLSVYEFTKQALKALGEDGSLVVPEPMPEDPPPEMLADTSLDCRRFQYEFNLTHPPIAESLRTTKKGK